jgi:uncharacterized protein (TIGR02145 family)
MTNCWEEGPACIDIDGNVYETIQIGDQLWMAENLAVTRYNNGAEISTGHTNEEWTQLATGAYAANDLDPDNADIYGYLYNWYAVDDDRGICPEGWHVGTDDEYKQLEMYLGMSESEADADYWDRGTNEGSKLAGNADLWSGWAQELTTIEYNSEFATSGFSALPGGVRSYYNGYSHDSGWYAYSRAYIWTSSIYDGELTDGNPADEKSWRRTLQYSATTVSRKGEPWGNGYSVRCIGD